MGVECDEALKNLVKERCSLEYMLKHVSKFDESYASKLMG